MRNHNLNARLLLALAVTATPALAQFDFDLEKRTSARLGQSLDIDVVGAPPSSFALIIPSVSGGPTPLMLIDPVDPRVLAVGTDLLSVMTVAITDGAGGLNYSLALPNDPSLNGFELHWQSATLRFAPTLIGEISNDVVTLTGIGDTGVVAPQTLVSPRAMGAILVDADNNNSQNDILITGGGAGTLTSAAGLASTELWDFRRMRSVPGPTMNSARALHSAVRLNDGRVLLVGGADATGAVLSTCEIYDPATNSITTTGSMGTPRILHGATVLNDGRVMVAGGTSTLQPDVVAAITGTLSSVEIYNPATGTWSNGAALSGRTLAPALTLLSTGKVMVSGGVSVTIFFGIPLGANSTTSVRLYDPANNSWTSGASMAQARAGHQYNQVTLNDGRVLMTGGVNVPSLLNASIAAPIGGAEVYNPTTNSWQTVNMPTVRALHSATVLADGRVAACGGAQGTLTVPVPIANVDVFDPTTNTWSSAPNLTAARGSHNAALMPDGTLLLLGGQGATVSFQTVETLRF